MTRFLLLATLFFVGIAIPAWASAWDGFNKFERTKWERAGFSAEEASTWKASGLGPDQATEWRAEGFQDAEALAWAQPELTAPDGTKGHWRPKIARGWRDAGFTAATATEWFNAIGPEGSLTLRKAGLTPSEAKAWKSIVKDAAEIIRWRDAGYNTVDTQGWLFAETPEAANEWKKAGFDPTAANIWSGRNFGPDDAKRAAKTVAAECKSEIRTAYDLTEANPFDTKGACFEFDGDQFQLLNRSKGLYRPEDSDVETARPVQLDFGKESAPRTFRGILKGTGTTSYTNVLGAKNTVPVLRPVLKFPLNGHD